MASQSAGSASASEFSSPASAQAGHSGGRSAASSSRPASHAKSAPHAGQVQSLTSWAAARSGYSRASVGVSAASSCVRRYARTCSRG